MANFVHMLAANPAKISVVDTTTVLYYKIHFTVK